MCYTGGVHPGMNKALKGSEGTCLKSRKQTREMWSLHVAEQQSSDRYSVTSPTVFLDLSLLVRSCSTAFACSSPLFHSGTHSKHNAKQSPATTLLDLSSGDAKSVTVTSQGVFKLPFPHILFWEMYLIKRHGS